MLFCREWESLQLSSWHRSLLRTGLTLPFILPPPLTTSPIPVQLPRDPSKRQVLLDEVQALLAKQSLERVVDPSTPGFYSHLFTVTKKSGGHRPVIDLKRLNGFIHCPHFHMETDRGIRSQLRPGEWTTSIDLSDAYLHIPVHPAFRKYLRLHILGETYQFRAMCFGLNIAPRVFTKLLEPVASYLRHRGVLLHRYLDDWLFRGPSPEVVAAHTNLAIDLFTRLGLLVNFQKSDLHPRTRFVFLGMDIDLQRAWIRPTGEELEKIRTLVSLLSSLQSAPVRLLLSFLGLLNHASQFIFLGRLHIRPLQFFVKAKVPNLRTMLYSSVPLDSHFRRALEFWADSSQLQTGVPLHPPPPTATLTTDASLEGWGAFFEGHSASGHWSPAEANFHISRLELRAVRLALQELGPLVQGRSLRLLADNTTAVAYIRNQGGTHSLSLFLEARDLLQWCAAQDIILHPFFLPGHLNSLADLFSRQSQVLGTEWTLHVAVFRRLHQLVPSLSVDLFATRLNHQLPAFVSPCPDPLAWAVDAFSLEWTEMVPYAYPPTKLIPEVLKKLRRSPIRLYLVAPHWPNQAWYPEVLDLLFDRPLVLPPWRRLLRQPVQEIYHQNPRLLALHVWPLSGIASDRRAFRLRLRGTLPPRNAPHLFGSMSLIGDSSPVGVLNETWIHPLRLFNT